MTAPQSIFDIASQYAFAGYSALSPLLVAALFWKGSTKWGALAVTLWTAAAVAGVAVLQTTSRRRRPAPSCNGLGRGRRRCHHPDQPRERWSLGFLPVVPMTIVSALADVRRVAR